MSPFLKRLSQYSFHSVYKLFLAARNYVLNHKVCYTLFLIFMILHWLKSSYYWKFLFRQYFWSYNSLFSLKITQNKRMKPTCTPIVSTDKHFLRFSLNYHHLTLTFLRLSRSCMSSDYDRVSLLEAISGKDRLAQERFKMPGIKMTWPYLVHTELPQTIKIIIQSLTRKDNVSSSLQVI